MPGWFLISLHNNRFIVVEFDKTTRKKDLKLWVQKVIKYNTRMGSNKSRDAAAASISYVRDSPQHD